MEDVHEDIQAEFDEVACYNDGIFPFELKKEYAELGIDGEED